jgi:hypothetical protein
VAVGIYQSREDGFARCIYIFISFILLQYVIVAANGNDLPIPDSHGLCNGKGTVYGIDLCMMNQQTNPLPEFAGTHEE